jgi:hypothetical protein
MKNILFSFAIILLIFGQASCKPQTKKIEESEGIKILREPPKLRKVTKEATISFETKDYKNACSSIKNLITKYHGQINNESDNIKENKDLEAEFEARIPANSFDLFLKELESVNGKIISKDINIEDITANYIDTEARLKSKKELEARYIQLLAKATKVTEMLEIEKQINDQQTEIESDERQFKFMQLEVANNLVHITITEPKIATSGFFGKILNALSNGWSFFIGFMIVLLTLWPFILFGCTIWYFLRRYLKKEKKRILMGQ